MSHVYPEPAEGNHERHHPFALPAPTGKLGMSDEVGSNRTEAGLIDKIAIGCLPQQLKPEFRS